MKGIEWTKELYEREMWKRLSIDEVTGCWVSDRKRTWNGYCKIKWRQKYWTVHRLHYYLFKGEIPKGLFVLHTCDNRQCCNPEHLYLGTAQDNAEDKMRRQRCSNKGIDQDRIYELYCGGLSERKIAKEVGCSHQYTHQVIVKFRKKSGQ